MAQLVQSACPGCKNVLHIPAEWLQQPIRCKHCGTVLQAKPTTTPARTAAVPPRAAGNRPSSSATRKPQASLAPAASPATPPAHAAAAAPPSSPFAEIGPREEDDAPRSRRRRRQRGGWWKGPAVALAVFLIAGIVAVANWDRIVALLPPSPEDEQAVAQNDKSKDPVAQAPRKNVEGKKPPTTSKAHPVKDNPKKSNPPEKGSSSKPPKSAPPKTVVTPKPVTPRPSNSPYPRRALVISVHDYLYANPIQNGQMRRQRSQFPHVYREPESRLERAVEPGRPSQR